MLQQHLNCNKHKKIVKDKKRRNSFSTDDGASSHLKDSEDASIVSNPFDEGFVDKTLTENSKIEQPRQTSMDSQRICLFCNSKAEGVKKNLDHMRKEHSFFILDIDCLISLKALLHYLAEKIHSGFCCINCNKTFTDSLSVQNHMKDLCHCCMNSDAFDDEYEYFYDFAPTYEEDFVGKKIEDFDLSEEPLAKPFSEKLFSKMWEHKNEEIEQQTEPMQEIVEEIAENAAETADENQGENDDDWEDIDVEDAQEAKEELKATTNEDSPQKESVSSDSSFAIIDKPSTESEATPMIDEEMKSLAAESNMTESEVMKLLVRRKKNRFDYQKVNDSNQNATVNDTGEIHLPNGKIIGHRQWAREYKQKIQMRDVAEQLIIRKLGIEYKKMGAGNTQIQKSFNREKMRLYKSGAKKNYIHANKKYMLKLGVKGNKVNAHHFRLQQDIC